MPTGPSAVEGLRSNRNLWESREPPAYDYILQRSSCECLPESLVPIRVTVHEGQIQSAVNVDSGALVSTEAQHVLSMDALFNLIEEAFEQDAFRVSVNYDLDYGYPSDIFIDYQSRMVDDQFAFTVRDLSPID